MNISIPKNSVVIPLVASFSEACRVWPAYGKTVGSGGVPSVCLGEVLTKILRVAFLMNIWDNTTESAKKPLREEEG